MFILKIWNSLNTNKREVGEIKARGETLETLINDGEYLIYSHII